MAKITLNGVDALTESGGVVTIPGAANLVLGTNSVPSAAIQADAITSAHLDTNIAVAGTLGVTGATTLSSTLGVTGATTVKYSCSYGYDYSYWRHYNNRRFNCKWYNNYNQQYDINS